MFFYLDYNTYPSCVIILKVMTQRYDDSSIEILEGLEKEIFIRASYRHYPLRKYNELMNTLTLHMVPVR